MPHALLLSPDDQAVSAITGVLEEMSVTCERPLDGASAAQKINSQSFDLVLVDCENLPAAKLIFDVCRRGKDGNNPVPIAIVDGRAGLPTAFRLGAELILTKPVAKDQARNTIRTAVSRVRKDAPVNKAPSPPASVEAPSPSATAERAQAAAASVSSQLTSFADSASSAVAVPAALSAPALETDAPSTAEEIAASADSASADPKIKQDNSEPQFALPPSEDPVLAELDRAEREAAESAAAEQDKKAADNHPPAPRVRPSRRTVRPPGRPLSKPRGKRPVRWLHCSCSCSPSAVSTPPGRISPDSGPSPNRRSIACWPSPEWRIQSRVCRHLRHQSPPSARPRLRPRRLRQQFQTKFRTRPKPRARIRRQVRQPERQMV